MATASTSAPAGQAGLPQFDPQWWPGQIVWCLVIFVVVFVLMRQVFVPRIGGGIEAREKRIGDDLATARGLRDESDAQAAAAAAEMAQVRANAHRLATEARDKAKAEIADKLAEQEAKLADDLAAAEARIREVRDAAMAEVGAIASGAATDIVGRLTGKAASAAEIRQAVGGRA